MKSKNKTKKTIAALSAILVLFMFFLCWNILGPVVHQPEKKYFFIKSGSSYEDVKTSLLNQKIISGTFFFEILAKRLDYNNHVKCGKYEIKDGSSLLYLVRMLSAGRQSPVRLVINKLRTKEDFAKKLGENFECDSSAAMRFLLSKDSLAAFGLDTNTVMTVIIPNSYFLWWDSDMRKIMTRLKKQHDLFWKGDREKKASLKKLTPLEVYTIASIVEEETGRESDKPLIANVYINRLSKKMKLEADPTVKYAMRDFGLKRIMHIHLGFESPYNTYKNAGLPPGPICTPSIKTIDAVLDAPDTKYVFFVAKPDFSGYSNFSETYSDHLLYANKYQAALDSLLLEKQNSKISH